MIQFPFMSNNTPTRSVYRWFLVGLVSFSLTFLVSLFPLISYCKNVFTELEVNKSMQQAEFGIQQLDNAVYTIINASQSIFDDPRFYSLHFKTTDYSEISVSDRNQMRDYLGSMLRPSGLIRDCALQLSVNDAITPSVTTIGGRMGYYPFYFQVDDLSFDQWTTIVQENHSGFLPVHHVTTPTASYDALIYSIQWAKNKYFYACIDIDNLRNALIQKDDLLSYRLTIEDSSDSCLYSDLTSDASDYYSIPLNNSSETLKITVHIPNSDLTARLKPLYSFMGVYLGLYVAVLIVAIIVGTHLSTKPFVQIITAMENGVPSIPSASDKSVCTEKMALGYGFHYIHDRILSYEKNLQQYQSTIDTQAKILQTRFMEKAIHGNLSSESDLDAFYTFFPEFPDSYQLILFGLSENPTKSGNIYPNALAIIQYYLEHIISLVYLQRLTAQTLLIVIDKHGTTACSDSINQLIENINQEEPCYHAWALASKVFSHPKDLAFAYSQLQDLRGRLSTDSLSQLCTASDIKVAGKTSFRITDTATIYSAIINGNLDVALNLLDTYSEHLNKKNPAVFEMFRSILMCIKQEHADLLIDIDIPFFRPQENLFLVLKESVTSFCRFFQNLNDDHTNSFAEQVKAYIDIHFVDAQLCSATLEEQFQCSFSKIRKSFSKDIGVPISSYIEQKRMALANELLLRGEYSVSEIALKCGFTNYNSFFKVYQRTHGHAPTLIKRKKAK